MPGAIVREGPARCPHCGTPVEGDEDVYCCAGCELAAQIIAGAGLEAYYEEREAYAPRPQARKVDWAALPVQDQADGTCEATFAIDGLRCASCTWVTEHVLAQTAGVQDAHVSYASGRAVVPKVRRARRRTMIFSSRAVCKRNRSQYVNNALKSILTR